MAEKEKDAAATPSLASSGRSAINALASNKLIILAMVNTLAVIGAASTFFFVKMANKRPTLTEHGERARLTQLQTRPSSVSYVVFEPATVNIEALPTAPKAADGTTAQIQGKLHYVTVGFALEIRDVSYKARIETLRPVIMDRLLSMLGRKAFHELTTIQGRYLLRSQILEFINQTVVSQTSLSKPAVKDGLVTNVFFTQFIVQ